MDRKEIKQLRILGIIGVVAAFLTILMDVFSGISGMFGAEYWEPLGNSNKLTLLFGAYGGVFIFPFWLSGI